MSDESDLREAIVDAATDGIDSASVDGLSVRRTPLGDRLKALKDLQREAAAASADTPIRFHKVISRGLQ